MMFSEMKSCFCFLGNEVKKKVIFVAMLVGVWYVILNVYLLSVAYLG